MTRLLGGDPQELSVLQAFVASMRLVHSLGSRPAQRILEGRLNLRVSGPGTQDLEVGQILTQIQRYLERSDLGARLSLQTAIDDLFNQRLSTPQDDALQEIISTDPALVSSPSVERMRRHYERVASAWTAAFDVSSSVAGATSEHGTESRTHPVDAPSVPITSGSGEHFPSRNKKSGNVLASSASHGHITVSGGSGPSLC